jgi:hypothetical protein
MRTTLTSLLFSPGFMDTMINFDKPHLRRDAKVYPPGQEVDVHPSHVSRSGSVIVQSRQGCGYAWAGPEDISQIELDAAGTAVAVNGQKLSPPPVNAPWWQKHEQEMMNRPAIREKKVALPKLYESVE